MTQVTPLFDYHISWKSKGKHPGRHKSNQRGMGIEFAGYTTLLSYPDPRRIDIRQSIRDPLGEIYVKMFNQRMFVAIFLSPCIWTGTSSGCSWLQTPCP
jgi:hypothetical protein